jgi:hypothetical protein
VTVTDGDTTTITFTAPGDSVMTTYTLADHVCGGLQYAIYADNDGTDTALGTAWVTMSGPVADTYTVSIDTTVDLNLIDDEASVDHTVYIKTTFNSFGAVTNYTPITITIDEVVCDCSHMLWVNPSAVTSTIAVAATDTLTAPLPTADTSQTTSVNAFQKCYQSGTCSEVGDFPAADVLFNGGALPAWITYVFTGNEV